MTEASDELTADEVERFLTLSNPSFPLVRDPAAPLFVRQLDLLLYAAHARGLVRLPNLIDECTSVRVFSDYGGEHKECEWHTYAALVARWEMCGVYLQLVREVRRKHGLDEPYKEFAFKDRGYGPLARALPEILHSADSVPGLLLVLVVDKKAQTILGSDPKAIRRDIGEQLVGAGLDAWRGPDMEKALRVAHVVAYLTALLTKEGQAVAWFTDHDSIAANDAIHAKLGELYVRLLDYYAPRRTFASISYGRDVEPGHRFVNDLLSLPDLAAGAVSELLAQRSRGEDGRVRLKGSEPIVAWLFRRTIALRKLVIRLRWDDATGLDPSIVDLQALRPEPSEPGAGT